MAATLTTGGSLWRQRLCWALAAYALVAGAISFLGWALDIPRLTDWEANGISIQPNAAVLVMLSGAALLLLQLRQHRIALAFGALVGVMGGLMLLQHVLGVDLGFNHQLTFGREWGGAGTVTRGRVGPPASTCFTLAGAALVLLGYSHAKSGRAHLRRFVPVLGLAVSVIALFSLIGYLSGAEDFYAIPWLTAIALQTSTMLMAIAVGLIASVPEHQPMRLLASSSGTGVLARRTLPMIVLLPLLLSGAATRGEALWWYDHGTGRSLLLLGIVLLGALSMWWALRILDRQERSARDSAVSLADTLESINDGFIRLDAQWRFTYVNRQAERFCDLGRGTLVGRTWHETFPSVLGTHPQQAFDRALREQTPVELESYHKSRQRWYGIKAHPMRDGGLALLIQDMTDRKHTLEALRRSEEQLASLFNVTSVGMAQTDPVTRRFVRVNAALCAITGYNDAELLATTVDELNHPDDRERDREVYDRLARGSSAYELEKRYVRKDGRAVWVHVTSNVVRDTAGRPVQAFSIVQDIGVRRRNEEALRDAARRKDEFLATLAHELRNPLAPVRNAVKILHLKGPAVPELQWARDVIDRQVQHMTRLIDDLLDVSRISRGKIKLQRERVDLAKVVHRAIEACRPLIEQHEHELSVLLPAEPVQVDGDFTRLVQVVSNLLDNAAKYSERGGRIVVTRRAARRRRRRNRSRLRDRPCTGHAVQGVRDFRAGGRILGQVARRSRHRPHVGEAAGRDARRPGRGAQRRAGQGQRVRRAFAAVDANRRRRRARHAVRRAGRRPCPRTAS